MKYIYMYILFYVIAENTATTPTNRAVLQSSTVKADNQEKQEKKWDRYTRYLNALRKFRLQKKKCRC